ncbi:MAG: MiaB/RimO family radical SAM methylthiotransferase [Oscillospiraceae bacterium]|nr:MiaB/RimO family radical SAM methylthiotransferase [Oscillospiraceae bacterium]
MKITLYTLGCRTNQAESAGMAEFLRLRGHTVAAPGEGGADAVVINTCTVTSTADKKSRNAIRKLRRQYPGALLAVCGCLPQTEALDMEGIDLIGGTANRAGFAEMLEAAVNGAPGRRTPQPLPDTYEDTLPDARPIGRSRAYLKIQDGCDNRCAYCKVPQARGRSRSRPAESVIRAARRAAAGGAVEIVLTGIEISSYNPSLADLTVAVCRAAAPVPVRLSSLDPRRADGAFVEALAGEGNFRPAFHLSLQSVCDKTLGAMNRRYGVSDVFAVFERLRGTWKDAVITADIIAGFPGETDGDFAETFQNLQRLKPDGLHVFPYSRRAGTAAAEMPGQNTRSVKAERVRLLMEAFPKESL